MKFLRSMPFRVLPAALTAGFVLSTMSHLGAEPAKPRRTRTPKTTPTAAAAAPAKAAAVAPTVTPSPVPVRPTAAAAAAPPPVAAGPAKADIEAGKAAYDKFCKKCHGAQGEGVERMYALVEAKIVHLGSRQVQSKSDAEVKRSITEGFGKMEVVEDVTAQQINQIIAFMRTLKN